MKNHLAPMLIMSMLCSAAVFSAHMPSKNPDTMELKEAAENIKIFMEQDGLYKELIEDFNYLIKEIEPTNFHSFKVKFNKSALGLWLKKFGSCLLSREIDITAFFYTRDDIGAYFLSHPWLMEPLAIYLFVNRCNNSHTIKVLYVANKHIPYLKTWLMCLSVKQNDIAWMNLKRLELDGLREDFNYDLFSNIIINNTSIEALSFTGMGNTNLGIHHALADIILKNKTITLIIFHYKEHNKYMDIKWRTTIDFALDLAKQKGHKILFNGPIADPELSNLYTESKPK